MSTSFIIECDGNKYGAGCQQSCGSCLRSEQCHHKNGSCLNGCDPGYQGLSCKDSKLVTHIEMNILYFITKLLP